jgi:hypothetical protein
MYRSNEILQIFSFLPTDIINYILSIERKILFKRQIVQWNYLSYLFHTELSRNLFSNDLKNIFICEIKDINGNFENLKQYKLKLWNIKVRNKNDALYLNSLRY